MHPGLGVYAVTGNHEYYGGIDKNMKILKRVGVEVLRNRVKEIAPGLFLAGIDDLTAMKRFGDLEASELINKTLTAQQLARVA